MREGLVEPLHQPSLRAEVLPQLFEVVRAFAQLLFALQALKDANVGAAEGVDGLHGIAHVEGRAGLVRLPGLQQPLQQFNLRLVRVLELIHQHVADAVAELQSQLRRLAVRANGIERALRVLRKVHAALAGKHQLQVRRRQG